MLPYGGTEIQYDYLRKYGDRNLLELVQITTSVPEKEPLHPLRPNILWIKNSYDQPNLAPWFTKKENHKKYDWYVFNSHWTYEKYRYFFNVPDTRSVVIKNGIDYEELKLKKDFTYKDPLRLVYFSTPWRGLDVLLNTMELLKDEKDIVLDVYSSTIIYGDGFHIENEPKFLKLYEQARDLKNVNYKGYLHHNELMEKLKEYHVSVHPSTFEETFCISAMEALAAGCMLITTDLGAIPETCAEFPVYIPYSSDKKHLAVQTAESIRQAREILSARDISQSLKFQQQYYKYYYDWKVIGSFWDRFLQGTIHARRKEKNIQT
ncbi:MAG TPA: glycosyltransferase [Flavobacteriales bacterium]|nr:glycosyltransferase [Flavobacteriales bacterium]HIB77296.1 glycosyltransferase [Flavobacteriales bacterium]|tara:strand:+ start:305 stop:1264 length:960 start_codon:yes stop_codon:yes gene_type:complete